MEKTDNPKVYFRDKRVLITGGLGMMGSSLAIDLIRWGAKVTLLDALIEQYGANFYNIEKIKNSPNLQVIIADIRDKLAIEDSVKHKDIIFNLAGQVSHNDSLENPLLDLDINYRGHVTVLEACLKNNRSAKIFYAGSRLQYGNTQRIPVDENHPRNPLTPYATNKNAAEDYSNYCHKRFGLKTVVFRIANPYGPRCQIKHNKYGIVNFFIKQALEGNEIRIFGDGRQIRDYLYIDDLTKAFLFAAIPNQTNGEVYNVGSGVGISFAEMASKIVSIVGKGKLKHVKWPAEYINVETGDYISDIGKIQKHTGWNPSFSLEEGIRRTVEYYRSPQTRNRYLLPSQIFSPKSKFD